MKRKNNIYTKIYERENIKRAIIKASKGKMSRKDVSKINENLDFYTIEIQEMLENKTYKASPYIKKTIHDGANKKERIIYKPCFYPDQIIHWALMLQIEEMLARGMYNYCCASIRGRGILYRCKIFKKNTCTR